MRGRPVQDSMTEHTTGTAETGNVILQRLLGSLGRASSRRGRLDDGLQSFSVKGFVQDPFARGVKKFFRLYRKRTTGNENKLAADLGRALLDNCVQLAPAHLGHH